MYFCYVVLDNFLLFRASSINLPSPNHLKNMLTDGSVLKDAIQGLNLPPLKKD